MSQEKLSVYYSTRFSWEETELALGGEKRDGRKEDGTEERDQWD